MIYIPISKCAENLNLRGQFWSKNVKRTCIVFNGDDIEFRAGSPREYTVAWTTVIAMVSSINQANAFTV